MTNEEIQEIVAKADDEYDRLKDRVHEQYDEIERLHSIIKEVREYINGIGWNTTIPNIQDNVWRILDKEE